MKIRTYFVVTILLILFPLTAFTEEVYFYHTDNFGTPMVMTDINGEVVWRSDELPFGEEYEPPTESPIKNNRRYLGKEMDEETGFIYMGSRYLNPATGQFNRPDPVGLVDPATGKVNQEMLLNPQRLNRYAYGLNNPYKYIDSDGRDAIYINYDYYPVTTPIGKLPLGHGGVVAVHPKTGLTKYYEFGRYGDRRGVVRGSPDIQIPNVDIGQNGQATKKSLQKLYNYLSDNLGKGSKISATYYSDSDFQGTVDYAEGFREKHPDYSLMKNNCKTFGKAAATAKKEKKRK